MVVSIAGNYDWDAFLALVNQYFDAFPNPNAEETPDHPQTFRSGRLAREKDTEQLHICMGFEGVPSGSNELYDISVFNNVLGGGMSSRLFQRIREDLGMAYTIYTYSGAYSHIGCLNLYVGTNPENGETVIREIQEELRKWKAEPMSEKEFLSAKAQLRSGYVMGLESSSGRMQSLGRGMLLQNELRSPEEVLAKIEAVTPERVMAVAEKVLQSVPAAAVVGQNAQSYLQKMGETALG